MKLKYCPCRCGSCQVEAVRYFKTGLYTTYQTSTQHVDELCDIQSGLQPFGRGYLQGLSNIHHRPLCKNLRDQAERHLVNGDALLNILGSPYSFAAKAAHHKYQKTIDNMRAHIPNRCSGSADEPKTTGRRSRRPDLPLRHQ